MAAAVPRKVRCPNCKTVLAEPPSPIFECPICSTLLLAKGARAKFQGEPLQSPFNRDGKDMVHTQQVNGRDANDGEGCLVEGQEQLACHDKDKEDREYGRLISEPSRVEGGDARIAGADSSKRREFESADGTRFSKELGQDDVTDLDSTVAISRDVEVMPVFSDKGPAEGKSMDISDGVARPAEEEIREHLELPSAGEVLPMDADERMVGGSDEAAALVLKERQEEELEPIAAADVIVMDGDTACLEEKMAHVDGEDVLLARDNRKEIKLEELTGSVVMDLFRDDKRDVLDGDKGIGCGQVEVPPTKENVTTIGREALVTAQLPSLNACADGMVSSQQENDSVSMSTFEPTSAIGGSNGREALVINGDAAIAVELPFSAEQIVEVVTVKQENDIVCVVNIEPTSAYAGHVGMEGTTSNDGLVGGGVDEIATQENRAVGRCEAMDGTNYNLTSTISEGGKEGDSRTLQSEIIRDGGYNLSFSKGVSAAKSVNQIAQQRPYREKPPILDALSLEGNVSDKPLYEHLNVVPPQSDESYSSEYESSDSEFDFPAPSSAEGLQSFELSDPFLVNKTSMANPLAEALGTPHQLEFVDGDLNDGYGEDDRVEESARHHEKMVLNDDTMEASPDIQGLSTNGHEAIAKDDKDTQLNGSGLMPYTSLESLVDSASGDRNLLKENATPMESDLYSVLAYDDDDASEAGVNQSTCSRAGNSLGHLYLYQNIRMAQASKGFNNVATSSDVPSWKDVRGVQLVGKKGLTPMKEQGLVVEQAHDGEGKLASLYPSQERNLSYDDGFSSTGMGRTTKGSATVLQRDLQSTTGQGQGPLGLLGRKNYQSEMAMGGNSVNHFGGYSVSTGCSFDGICSGSQHMGDGIVPAANRSYLYQLPSHLPIAAGGHGVSHCEYHAVTPACMLCMLCQHLPHPHMPSCALCYSHSVSMAHQHGYNHAHAPHQAAVPAFDAQGRATPLKPQTRKLRHYPPLPQGGTAPYFMCKGCNHLLHVPEGLNPIHGATQKLQCGECGKVLRFSVRHNVRQRATGGLPSSAMDPTREALTSAPSSAHLNRLSLQPSFVSLTWRSMDHQGSVRMHSGPGLHRLPHPSSGDFISSERSSHEVKLVESHARRRGFDSSSNLSFEFKAPPSGLETESFGNGGLSSRLSPFVQTSVDEKDEGLDYGAPRMSDGDSLDQRSPESRMRSPEKRPAFPPVKEDMVNEAAIDSGEIPLARGNSLRHPSFGRLQQSDPRVKRTLIALLNQESTKFEINFEDRGSSFDDSQSAVWSLASDSPGMQDELGSTDKRPVKGTSVPRGLSSQNYLRRGPRFIVGLMRRSLKDLSKRDSIKRGHEEQM